MLPAKSPDFQYTVEVWESIQNVIQVPFVDAEYFESLVLFWFQDSVFIKVSCLKEVADIAKVYCFIIDQEW